MKIFKYLLLSVCLFVNISFAAQNNEQGKQNEQEKVLQVPVDPVLVVGNEQVFYYDISPLIEALSIASFREPRPYYPIFAYGNQVSDASNENAELMEILQNNNWKALLLQENANLIASRPLLFLDNLQPISLWAIENDADVYLIQAEDFSATDVKAAASRSSSSLEFYNSIAKKSNMEVIPLGHLLARFSSRHNMELLTEEKNLTLEASWYAAAIIYIGMTNSRPANPDPNKLYLDLREQLESFWQLTQQKRFDLIDLAWSEWQRYQRLVK